MISVVIPTFRRQSRLRDLLGSLERQLVQVPFEVIVVANLPEAGLKKIVEAFGPNFKFHETGRIGVNIARNKGLERARGEIVTFLDDDMFVGDRDFLQRVWNAHAAHPEALAIGGPYAPKDAMTAAETAYHWILEHDLRSAVGERDEVRFLRAGNVSFKASGLEPRHRFDDRVLFGGSELSLFARLRREQNLFLLMDSLAVEHRAQVSLYEIARRAFFQGYGRGLSSIDAPPERPSWNSSMPLEEMFRRAHINETALFGLTVRLYRLFFAHGSKLGGRDAAIYQASLTSKKVIYRRPELTPLKMLSAFFGKRPSTGLRPYLAAFRATTIDSRA